MTKHEIFKRERMKNKTISKKKKSIFVKISFCHEMKLSSRKPSMALPVVNILQLMNPQWMIKTFHASFFKIFPPDYPD